MQVFTLFIRVLWGFGLVCVLFFFFYDFQFLVLYPCYKTMYWSSFWEQLQHRHNDPADRRARLSLNHHNLFQRLNDLLLQGTMSAPTFILQEVLGQITSLPFYTKAHQRNRFKSVCNFLWQAMVFMFHKSSCILLYTRLELAKLHYLADCERICAQH